MTQLITPLNGTRRVRAAGEDDDDDPNDRTYSAARRSTSAASRSKMQSRAGQRKAEEDDSHAAQSTEQQREPLHFKGVYTSDGSEGHPNRSVRGTVRMTKDGEIHWCVVPRYRLFKCELTCLLLSGNGLSSILASINGCCERLGHFSRPRTRKLSSSP